EHEAGAPTEVPTATPASVRARNGDVRGRFCARFLRFDGDRRRSLDWLECRDAIEYISSVAPLARPGARPRGGAAARAARRLPCRCPARRRARERTDESRAAVEFGTRGRAAGRRRRARARAFAARRE